jgi:hypothetical protein
MVALQKELKMLFERTIRRADRQSDLMRRMFDRLGIDLARAARRVLGIELASVSRTCMSCRRGTECEAWLSSNREGDRYAFCPNAPALDRIRSLQEGRSWP